VVVFVYVLVDDVLELVVYGLVEEVLHKMIVHLEVF
jgi:hypothetical protein